MKSLTDVIDSMDLNLIEKISALGIPGKLSDRDTAIIAASMAVFANEFANGKMPDVEAAAKARIKALNLCDENEFYYQTGFAWMGVEICKIMSDAVSKLGQKYRQIEDGNEKSAVLGVMKSITDIHEAIRALTNKTVEKLHAVRDRKAAA